MVVIPPTASNLEHWAGQKLHSIAVLGIDICLQRGIWGCYHHPLGEGQEVSEGCNHFSPHLLRGEPWQTRRRRGPVTGKAVSNCVCQHHRLPRAHCCLVKGGAAPPIKARWWCWWCHWFAAVCCVVSMAPGDRWMCVGCCYLEVWLDIYWEQPCWSGLKDDWGLCGSVEKTRSQVCGIPM